MLKKIRENWKYLSEGQKVSGGIIVWSGILQTVLAVSLMTGNVVFKVMTIIMAEISILVLVVGSFFVFEDEAPKQKSEENLEE